MTMPRANHNRGGFTLIEILLAAMILAIGFMMLLPAFTVGVAESRTSIDAATALQVAQNAEACCLTMLRKDDPNWAAGSDGQIHAYQWNIGGLTDAIGTDATGQVRTSIRVHGDLTRSRFYWDLLYRIDPARPNQIELWIMVCKREDTGDLNGIMEPVTVGISGSAGSDTFNGNGNTVPGGSLVTNTGEIVNCMANENGKVTADRELTGNFSGVWMVPSSAGDADNACIYVAHTKKSF